MVFVRECPQKMGKKFFLAEEKKDVDRLPLKSALSKLLATFGFSKRLRLLHKSDFLKIRSSGSKRVFRHWVLFYLKNEDSLGRLGISVRKKYGSSVERNSFRRFIRENFRKNQKLFKGYDLHFVAKQKGAELEKIRYKAELKDDFTKLIHWIS